jgi:2,4-dienoyl-CoA reductase-like NADH-dependent reductase (Old Yellow Enzyme family)
MLKQTLSAAEEVHGAGNRRFSVLQLTHSGRYSRPGAEAQPIIAARNPFLDPKLTVAPHVISDAELAGLEEDYVAAARLAHAAGFDAVDVKACHRYLINELLAAHTRKGEYGGTFENRARFLCNVVAKIKAACPELAVTLRLNVYDGLSYPYGWGVNQEDPSRPDLGEPLRLLGVLRDQGVSLVNLTMGNPYYAPHINRPYDQGPYRPPEHPLVGVHRMLALARTVQRAIPDLLVVGTGLSWLRQLGPQVAAACLQEGWFALAGFGRQMFAYPDLVRDLIAQGALNPKKCCLACGKCSEIMRYGGSAGCVIRDARMYAPVYKAVSAGKPSLVSDNPAEHV